MSQPDEGYSADSPNKKVRLSDDENENDEKNEVVVLDPQLNILNSLIETAGVKDEIEAQLQKYAEKEQKVKNSQLIVKGDFARLKQLAEVYDLLPNHNEERVATVDVVPEPSNPYDPNAKMLLARVEDRKAMQEKRFREAKILAKQMNEDENPEEPYVAEQVAGLITVKPILKGVHIGYLPKGIETDIKEFTVLICFSTSRNKHYAKVTAESKQIREAEIRLRQMQE
ncbi:MAG: hypothetical protein ACTSUE_22825 [Promethearchaeota archaeon]